MNDVLTGASGFLGNRLREKLDRPICIPHQAISNFSVFDHHNFYFLSTYGNMAHHAKDFDKILKANVTDLSTIVGQILRFDVNCDSFVFVSSSSVKLPVQTPYSRTKFAAEQILQSTDLPYCIVRPYSICGVSEQKEHLIPTLIRSCFTGEKIDFVPDATHDFIDVEDVCNGLINLAESNAVGVFEFGTGVDTSNEEVLAMVEKETGKTANVRIVKNLRPYDTKEWFCDDFTARDYGWEATKPLSKSIKEMVEAYEE